MSGDLRSLFKYWGKANARDSAVPDHALVFHSMDVAACARVYLDHVPALTQQLAKWLGLPAEAARDVVAFLLAVHDVGKFAENFQMKAPHVVTSRFGGELAKLNGTMSHDDVGALFFAWAFEDRPKPERMRGWDDDVWTTLLTAVVGHHGTPPMPAPRGRTAAHRRLRSAMSERGREDAWPFLEWCANRFLPSELATCADERAKLASWWIAGLAVLADWIGSNTAWFSYADEVWRGKSLDEYWENRALPLARKAILEAGVVPVRPRPYMRPDLLFSYLRSDALRPAQALCAALTLSEEPQVFFLEDATGSGKTEAALILAARLMDAGLADGMFFALPTQATADQMFDRALKNIPRWFDDSMRATLVLAHGARDQVKTFQSFSVQSSDAVPGELDTASLCVTQWLAQSNKRALQAQIGVGTLDQVLMAALRVKHQSLRVLGLFRKVLLVDEVHSYDPYMTHVLMQTLRLHAASGGSAILISATMSREQRSRLLRAYAEGAALWRQPVPEPRRRANAPRVAAKSLEYPLLTRWGPSFGLQPEETAFAASAHSHRKLDIEYLSAEKDVLARMERWHAAGQAIVWVRNTVTDAIAAWEKLADRFGADRCTLFHSRFAAVDRRRIQNEVLHTLGKDGNAVTRSGRIIVTTQVFQESLDADADQMICDLCPVDVLLQRLGRYRRHRRAANGDPLPAGGPDGRSPGSIVVFGPDRAVEPDTHWYSRFSPGAAKVYGAHGRIYRGARAIGECIDLPAQVRSLIEAVYGDDPQATPYALQTADDRALGGDGAQGAVADMNVISLGEGYFGGDWSGDERIGTRLGDSVEATLVRVMEDGAFEPWARGRCDSDDDEWELSAIRLPGWWLSDQRDPEYGADLASALVRCIKALRPALKHRMILPMSKDARGWRCVLAGPSSARLSYCDRRGLYRRP